MMVVVRLLGCPTSDTEVRPLLRSETGPEIGGWRLRGKLSNVPITPRSQTRRKDGKVKDQGIDDDEF
jgi:hypothetical protein